jgi:hypothetical protein
MAREWYISGRRITTGSRPQRIPAVETAEFKELVRVGDALHGRLMIISAFQLAENLYNCGLF